MGIFDGRRGKARQKAPDPITSLYCSCLSLDPSVVTIPEAQAVLEPGDKAWETLVEFLAGGDSPRALLLLRGPESPEGVQALQTRLEACMGERILKHASSAPAWRLELARRRLGASRCRIEKSGASALILDEGLARLLAAKPVSDNAFQDESGPASLGLESPGLLCLPALLCPREWQAGPGQASVSWRSFREGPRPGPGGIRWTAAWSSGNSRMGFFYEVYPPEGSQASAEAVAKAVEPILGAAWKKAWPGLAALLPGIAGPVFGRTPATAARTGLCLEGRLLAGAASLEFALILPLPLLGLLPGAEGGPKDSPLASFLAVNDELWGRAFLASKEAGPSSSPVGLPLLPSLLSLFGEADLARLVQGYFLPALGALGFQALFFCRKAGGEADSPKTALPLQPFDERRLLASLPEASREEWVAARKAGLPLVQGDRAGTIAQGKDSLGGLWDAFRKGRLELSYGGRCLLVSELGDGIEAVDRAGLADLVARDLPLALLADRDKLLTRRVLDRLSARDLAVASWGSKSRRPLLERNLSQGKKAELGAETGILNRRLANGEEAPGAVLKARLELGQRIEGILEGVGKEEEKKGARR